MPDELTPFAVELITKCPQLINLFAEKINRMINNWDEDDPLHEEELKPVFVAKNTEPIPQEKIQELISHVGYTPAQCGYDK